MSHTRKKLIILDGNSLLHRAWHALPPLTTHDGRVVNAAYGFAMVVDKMLKEYQPEYMAVAWDLPGKTFRHEAVDTYKATRVKQPQELYDQIPICKKILEGYGVPSIESPGFEGDDVIGTISNLETKQGFDTLIVTGDLDALQLVDDNTHVLFFVKGVSQVKEYDSAAVEERYGFGPEKLIDFKAMRGDSSDNIKGVPGVGEKTAAELIEKFGTLEEMYKALEAGKPDGVREKLAENLLAHKRDAIESKMLVTIIRDVKLDFKIEDALLGEPDDEALLELYRELEFRSLVKKLESCHHEPVEGSLQRSLSARGGSAFGGGYTPAFVKTMAGRRDDKKIGKDDKKRTARHDGDNTVAILALEGQADLFGGSFEAVAMQSEKGAKLVEHPKVADILSVQSELVSAEKIITHDVKSLWHSLGINPSDISRAKVFDTMLASYLLHSGSRAHDFETVASDALGKPLQPLSVKNLSRAVSFLPDIAEKFEARMKEEGLLKLFNELEIPTASILYRMERDGIELDVKFLNSLGAKFEATLDRLTKKIYKFAGIDFNINSPSQLADVLFERLQLTTKGIKKIKTGFSTAASELEKLYDTHDIIPAIMEYREAAKLKSTYVDALPSLVDKDGRVHTTFNQAVTATGRLSSSDPNLQNIPVRTDLGREIRKAFVAPRGKVLISADYSQIELRLAAIMAGDTPFINAFLEGADIHTRTASEMFGVEEKNVTKEQRRAAKAINFGILYGMGPHALARNTGVSFEEARYYIDKYFEVHHAIADYIAEVKTKIHTDGYVETLSGRRRYIPEIHSGVPQLVAQAERMAVNMPIQGTEADVLKMAMIAAQKLISESYGDSAKMLLQVHDELVFEVEESKKDKFMRDIKKVMEGVVSYKIPMVVDVSSGKNWGELK